MRSIILDHNTRYPAWQIDDLYKLLLQASKGAEHIVTDRQSVAQWLDRELASLDGGPVEPLIEDINPVDEFVRVHLRPFAKNQLDKDQLLEAFLSTTALVSYSMMNFSSYATLAARLCAQGLLPFPEAQVKSYLDKMQTEGLPAMHHSQNYRELYHPAYRVVARCLLPSQWLSLDATVDLT